MPRSNRPRRPRDRAERNRAEEVRDGRDLARSLFGGPRTETRRGREFVVQSVSASSAVKEYTCPGCALTVSPGTPHLVVWRADGLFGEQDDLASRRHWHTHCWRIS
ncbi:hypothetical protein IFT77_03610 [Frigoribacterium sp. CFBP 13729]|jgi:hypothetical protein|uniref:hypothetical protein n=1 Tax=Frigoribacterium sp. CFBP 13729 TaxID=2775293 RepID=UPI0017855D7A|nr:hypothetical protein [Frigoribacterium sp. CFBP 13729]MBD8609572.1 hypothetical protein [Frigoribacterium sp. CFBP 13729]